METEKTFADSKRTVCLGTGEAKFEVEYQEIHAGSWVLMDYLIKTHSLHKCP